MSIAPTVFYRGPLKLATRARADIINELDLAPPDAGMNIQVADFKREYIGAIHRPVGPCRTYNCHGLTFGSRRTVIWHATEVAKILKDDGYDVVPIGQVLSGDVAVYYSQEGDIEHSGIVVNPGELSPFILSKWGKAHEVVHLVSFCPYDASRVRYYRICK
jgi:hypothetical protein